MVVWPRAGRVCEAKPARDGALRAGFAAIHTFNLSLSGFAQRTATASAVLRAPFIHPASLRRGRKPRLERSPPEKGVFWSRISRGDGRCDGLLQRELRVAQYKALALAHALARYHHGTV